MVKYIKIATVTDSTQVLHISISGGNHISGVCCYQKQTNGKDAVHCHLDWDLLDWDQLDWGHLERSIRLLHQID